MDVNSTSTIASGYAAQGSVTPQVHSTPKAAPAPAETTEAAAAAVNVSTAQVVSKASEGSGSGQAGEQESKKKQGDERTVNFKHTTLTLNLSSLILNL